MLRRWLTITLIAIAAIEVVAPYCLARGGFGGGGGGRVGGGGGGGRMGGGGGGFSGGGFQPSARPSMPSRPSSVPSFNRPSGGNVTRPSTPNISRPSLPSGGSGAGAARPNLPNRPNLPGGGLGSAGSGNIVNLPGQGNNLRPGTRPDIRPGTLPGNIGSGDRPGIGTRPGLPGSRPDTGRPDIGNLRPGDGTRPGSNLRPGDGLGSGDRPVTLPGLRPDHRPGNDSGILPGNRLPPGAGDRLPGAGRPWDNFNPNRNDWLANRHDNLNNRFDQLNDHWNDRYDHWNDWASNHADWYNWSNYNYWYHSGWYHGYWPPPAGSRWNYLWDEYPVAMAFGVTRWGLNTLAYRYGLWGYYNPYYTQPVYYNNQQIVAYDQPVIYDNTQTANADAATQSPSDETTQLFEDARTAFYEQRYADALALTNQVLAKLPNDALVNEFRALCLFALGDYQNSAATMHAVLAVGPGWDWTTLSGMYSSNDIYTEQLRKLESHVKSHANDAAAHFLLAYHYLTCGHHAAAVKQLEAVVKLQPKDDVSAQLLKMNSPSEAPAPAPASNPPPDLEEPGIPLQQLYGTWSATQDNGQFQLQLTDKDEFVWTYTHEGKAQTVKGAYTVRAKNLAMEPDSGGVMLADITLDNGKLEFTMIDGGPSLEFHK